MPFITAGDPDIEFTSALLQSLDGAGCHLAELGIPYSDPIADGPVIQASYTRALNKKIKLESILKMATDANRIDGQLRHYLPPRNGQLSRQSDRCWNLWCYRP